MITLYYIGGPWDLVKRALPQKPVPVIIVREEDRPAHEVRASGQVDIKFKDHGYFTQQIGRDTFIAVHNGIQP